MRTPDSELTAEMDSARTPSTPPDISLPMAMTALVGEMQVSWRMRMCWLGIPMEMPYSSQPLFMATQSSPEMM